MRILSQRDTLSATVTGLTTGLIAWRILVFLGHALPLGIDPVVLVLLTPIAWAVGVQFGYFLGMFIRPFIQFGKFACIGFANAAVDFGVLYLLIGLTGLAAGIAYTVFKTISFSVATAHSYVWNKYWAFDAGSTSAGGRELASFLGVSVASLLVNVGVASLVVALRPGSVPATSWAGVSAVAGSALALIFSFTGFRVFVFRKK